MSRTPGIIVAGSFGLSTALGPVSVETASAYWLVSVQSGPFDSRWRYASPKNEQEIERKWIDVPSLANTDSTCWRPNTFPRLAEHVIVDEWSYFFAFRCAEDQVVECATKVDRIRGSNFGPDFFTPLPKLVDLFLMHVDGWWEYYTHHVEWQERIKEAFPKAFVRSWREAGNPP